MAAPGAANAAVSDKATCAHGDMLLELSHFTAVKGQDRGEYLPGPRQRSVGVNFVDQPLHRFSDGAAVSRPIGPPEMSSWQSH